MDYSKYTDEGWYGSGAIRYFLSGSWRLPGDFNPAAALPVWPVLEGLVFHFTGVSLVAARVLVLVVFAGNLWLTYALVRTQQKQWVALLAATIAAARAFLYAFRRRFSLSLRPGARPGASAPLRDVPSRAASFLSAPVAFRWRASRSPG